jgi:hypothetical protein
MPERVSGDCLGFPAAVRRAFRRQACLLAEIVQQAVGLEAGEVSAIGDRRPAARARASSRTADSGNGRSDPASRGRGEARQAQAPRRRMQGRALQEPASRNGNPGPHPDAFVSRCRQRNIDLVHCGISGGDHGGTTRLRDGRDGRHWHRDLQRACARKDSGSVAGCGPGSQRKDRWSRTCGAQGFEVHASEGNVADGNRRAPHSKR